MIFTINPFKHLPKQIGLSLFLIFGGVQNITAQQKIVSIGGTLTEILFDLGLGNNIIGVDATSVYPLEVEKIKNLGYRQSINIEGIISLEPDIVVASSKLTPQKLIDDLKTVKIKVLEVKEEDTFENAFKKIELLSQTFKQVKKGKELIQKLQTDLEQAKKLTTTLSQKDQKKLIFIYARGGNRVFLGGADTAANEMIKLSGAKNAFEKVSGFKPITTESLVMGNPEAVVMLKSGATSMGEGPWSINGIKQTQAGKNQSLILVDDLAFLGFGPRSGKELINLITKVKSLP